MRTLILTSPVMRGENVRLAQRRLNNFDCYAGPEDGSGPERHGHPMARGSGKSP